LGLKNAGKENAGPMMSSLREQNAVLENVLLYCVFLFSAAEK